MTDEMKAKNPPHCKHLMMIYEGFQGKGGRCTCCGQRADLVIFRDRALSADEIKAEYEKQLKEEKCWTCKD